MPIVRAIEGGRVVNQDLIDVYDFLGALRKRLALIAIMAVVCTLIMAVVAYEMTPVYRAQAVLDPVTSDSNPLTSSTRSSLTGIGGGLAALATGVTEGDRDTDEAMTVIGSRQFTENFIQNNNLLPLLFPKRWDAKANRWKDGVKVPTLARGFVEFDKIRKVDRNDQNDFVTLQIDWPDRVKVAEWTNSMIRMLNDELRKREVTAADAALAYLHDELANTNDVATQEAISRLIEAQLKTKMLATVTPEFELRFIDKALPADADYPNRPNKPLMLAIGFVFGALLGVGVCLILYRRELAASGRL
jgi:uncharacterized protein involved in exopolysaccharide biosynthesis